VAKSERLEERLAALGALRADPTSDETLEALRRALASKTGLVVGRAAEIAGEFLISELEPHLVEAFDRFMNNPAKTDPGCIAKTAIVEALYRMEAYQPDVYLNAIGHVQMEPVWGGREDTAAKLRGLAALGLVRINYPNVMLLLAQLLADPEADARISAARAIGYAGMDAGLPLLRFKALTGDAHPQVVVECFTALIQLDPEASLSFVAGFLRSEQRSEQEAAAVALGESHLAQAFPFLEAAWEDAIDGEMRQALMVAIALLRHERAIDFLLGLLAEGGRGAEGALSALQMYETDDRIWGRVERVLRARGASGRL
jgi:hypothetical protein